MHRRRRHERDDGEDRRHERRTEQRAPDVVDVGEALRERDRQEERHQDLHTGQDDAQFLHEPVVPVAELFAVALVVELVGRHLAVFGHAVVLPPACG